MSSLTDRPATRTTAPAGAATSGQVLEPGATQPTGPLDLFGQLATAGHRAEVLDLAVEALVPTLAPSLAHLHARPRFTRMVAEVLDWLDGQDGDSYQDRWVAGGADTAITGWPSAFVPGVVKGNEWRTAVDALIVVGVLRPSYGWLLLSGGRVRLWEIWVREREPALFTRLAQTGAELGLTPVRARTAVLDLVRMSIRTGRPLPALTPQDIVDYRAAYLACRGPGCAAGSTYYAARAGGLFAGGPPEFRSLLTVGRRTGGELVEASGIRSPTMRRLLEAYLTERQPDLDHTTFVALARHLTGVFWRDIEAHHPGIDTHVLTREQTEAWMARVAFLRSGGPRKSVSEALLAVRCLYLDVNHWANDSPERWAHWATPAPVTRQDVRRGARRRRAATAQMHDRVRGLVPRLPQLVRSARQELDRCTVLLAAVSSTARPDEPFAIGGGTYIRLTSAGSTRRVLVRGPGGDVVDAVASEHRAFWAWAVIEVLRHTGIRIEELLELTHHSIRPYRQANGEVVPLLQIAPSKTDTERVIPASPALAIVLARIVTRVAGSDGRIPLTSRHDEHERVWSAPLPHLFSHRPADRPRAFTAGSLREYLTGALQQAGLTTSPRERFTPHDFRRLFTTEAVNAGLPIHIAAALLGHQDLNTTMAYTAIYPQEVFERYQQFLTRRRTERPVEDYRAPTAAELAEFAEHFGKRRIELGTCARPYASPCAHEHACLRCPFQQVDPVHLPQLHAVEADIAARIEQARDQAWLGDIDQLTETLLRVQDKRRDLESSGALPAAEGRADGTPAVSTASNP